MTEHCQQAQNSIDAQGDMFRLADRDHGLSLQRLHLKTKISKNTLKGWANGTVMPAWALFKLGSVGGIPDHLLSLVGEPFERHVGTDETGDGDLDTAGIDMADAVHAIAKARHPASPGGVAIVPQEVAQILPLIRTACSSARRTYGRA